jgi:photosystem II stability/assembly factor-like uncharacterized protein
MIETKGEAGEPLLVHAAFEPQDSGKELFDTSFNALFNLLIEVIVLTVAFIIFFAGFQERTINAPVANLIYDSRKASLAQGFHEFLRNDPADLPSIFARLPFTEPPRIPGAPTVPGVPAIPGLPGRPEDGSAGLWVWDLMTSSAPWEPRFMHAAVTRGSELFLSAGIGSLGGGLQDVWRSGDAGGSWEQVAAAPTPFGIRNQHRMAALPNGNLILSGGINYTGSGVRGDVYRSRDGGKAWQLVLEAAPWGKASGGIRYSHGFVSLPNGSLLVVGGSVNSERGSIYDGQVWRSFDEGATWTRLADVAPDLARTGHVLVYHPNTNGILLIGGFGGQGVQNDVWRSTDGGLSWQRIVFSAPWAPRYDHRVVALQDGTLILMGGRGGSGTTEFRDVWRSSDGGLSWGLLTREAPWQSRREFEAVAVRNEVLVMGGILSSGQITNDVWRLRNLSVRADGSVEDLVSGNAAVELKTRILQRFILSLADADPNNNGVAVHNIWVKRAALILMAMAVVAALVAIFVYRVAVPKAKNRVNLARILALNLIIFIGTFAIQAVFMIFFTLKYIPIKPSLQLETMRERFNARAQEAIRRNEESQPTLREGEELIPTSSLIGNGVILGMLLVVAAVVYLAWKKRAFQHVSLFQAALMGCITVGIVIIGMYFFIQRTYAPKIIERVSDELAKAVVDKTVTAIPDRPQFESFMAWLNGTFDAQIADMQQTTNVFAEERNAMLLDSTVKIAGIVLAGLVLYIVAIQWYRRRSMPKDKRQSWGKFIVAILLVGLVAGTTSILVEFGFANNILSNYISTNPGKLVNNTIVNLNTSFEKHKDWFLERKCPTTAEPCSPSVVANINQMRYTGDEPAGYWWFTPGPESAPGARPATCEFEKTCDLCCERGPFVVEIQGGEYRSDRINLPIGVDQDRMQVGDKVSVPCIKRGDWAQPICPPGNWDEERQVCTQWTGPGQEDWEIRKNCSTWRSGDNDIWRRHVPLNL